MIAPGTVVAFSGGVGGAKLALGLQRILPPGTLVVVANTADDFDHLGLHISPDLDTLLYALAGVDNPKTGWGRREETWNALAALGELGAETWFRLGDRDLAVHIERTRRLRNGELLSEVTAAFVKSLSVPSQILPMSDDPVMTRLATTTGWLDFQDYFVRLRCEPKITDIAFEGVQRARPHPAILEALASRHVRAVVICPSNPFISIDPILAVPGVRAALLNCRAPRVAVSPIIAGQAVKGPTAKMMHELGMECTAEAVAQHYAGLIDGYVVDSDDLDASKGAGVPVFPAKALMVTMDDRERLAAATLNAAASVGAQRR